MCGIQFCFVGKIRKVSLHPILFVFSFDVFLGEDCSSNVVHQDRRGNLWNQTAQVVGGVKRFEKSLLPAEMGGEEAPL